MGTPLESKMEILNSCKDIANKIIEGLNEEDEKKKLNCISLLEELPDLSKNSEIKELKEYKEVRDICKKVYIETARTLMSILTANSSFSGDSNNSFNYNEPIEPILAAGYIKLLPNAYIGGPMKAAVYNPSKMVKQIIVDHYDEMPADFKYSGVFPSDFKQKIREIKSELSS